MKCANVESVPGGLLDLLLRTAGLGAPTDALARGRALEASEAIERISGRPVPDAWHYLASHSALLALPDDGALPYVDAVDARPPWPHQPEELPPDHPDHPVTWAIVQLCVGLRDLRGMLPPLADPRTSPAASLLRMGRSVIERTRTETVPRWRALDPYLDLLEADLAGRAGEDDLAWSLLASARSRFAAQGNGRAVADGGRLVRLPVRVTLNLGPGIGQPRRAGLPLVRHHRGPRAVAPGGRGASCRRVRRG